MPTMEGVQVSVKNILFATDFSPCSEAAVPLVESIARRYGSKVYMAHVLSPTTYLPPAATGSTYLWPEDATAAWAVARASASKRLSATIRSAGMRGLPHEALLLEGDVVDQLTKSVQEHKIDLIVVGTHGKHGLAKLVMGSVAETITRVAPCPVLVVGPKAQPERRRGETVRRILYATDFTPDSTEASLHAISLAKTHHARLTVLTVLAPDAAGSDGFWPAYWSAKERLRKLIPPEAAAKCQIEYLVDFGPAAVMILKNALNEETDVIVLGDRGGRFARPEGVHQSGRVTYKVMSEAPCAVLTVPGKPNEGFRF